MRSQYTGLLWMCQTGTLLQPCTISVGNIPPLPMWNINWSCKFLGKDSECKSFFLPGSLTRLLSPVPISFHSQLPLYWLLFLFVSSPLHLGWSLWPVVWAGSSSPRRHRSHAVTSSAYMSPLHWLQICIFVYLSWTRSPKSQSHMKI